MEPQIKDRLKKLTMKPLKEAERIRNEGKQDRLIAWVTSDNPHSILEAMDIICLYPENHSAASSAKKKGAELCRITEGHGYARDLCSYFRINLGSVLAAESPIEPLPKPDFLLCSNNICDVVIKWYQILAEILQVPVFFLDVPHIPSGMTPKSKENAVNYIKEQLMDLTVFLEKLTGKPFNWPKLRQATTIASKTNKLWEDILGFGKQRPSPITAFDAFSHMGPIVTQRVTQEGLTYYQLLKKELEKKVRNQESAVPHEKYRLFWDNIAIWYKLRDLSQKLASLDACLVASSYTSCWAKNEFYSIGQKDPLKNIAEQLISCFLNQDLDTKVNYCLKLIKEFSVDGAIIHANRSCKSYTGGALELRRKVLEGLGLPVLIIEADQCDERYYNESGIENQLNVFADILKTRGGRK